MKGHPYVKSGIDVACWDILGKVAGMPVCDLLGGRYGEDFVLYRAISQQSPEEMAGNVAGYRAEGYKPVPAQGRRRPGRRHRADQGRLRRPPNRATSSIADANTGWLMHEAARVVRGVRDVDVYIEQPCASYEECLDRPPPDRPPVRPRRVDRRPRRCCSAAMPTGRSTW